MRISAPTAAAALLLAGCGSAPDATAPGNAANGAAPAVDVQAEAQTETELRWDLQSSGEGAALALLAEARTQVRLFCPAGANRLLVNVPGFRPVPSEERMSFGSGGEVVTLVADAGGDRRRGGVTGEGEMPDNLAELVAGHIAVNYGNQNSGPHPVAPADLVQSFVAACAGAMPAAPPPNAGASACQMQGSERLQVAPLRAVGTEPFWGARIEGRCVTYSHPDDQAGTRLWTRYTPDANGGGSWVGALGGQRFELTARAEPGCSDGMSDRRYPIAVELIVGGERRRGCAAPL